MEEFFRFVQQSQRERNRLVQDVRAMGDRVFPPAVPVSEERSKAIGRTISGANSFRDNGVFS